MSGARSTFQTSRPFRARLWLSRNRSGAGMLRQGTHRTFSAISQVVSCRCLLSIYLVLCIVHMHQLRVFTLTARYTLMYRAEALTNYAILS
jgi:hypothetical protein